MDLINNITIKNYKSLQEVHIEGCRRYNLFIGRPNVGKSNILESLSLFQLPYLSSWKINSKALFRIENASSLFFLGNVENNIEITADALSLNMTYRNQKNLDLHISNVDGTATFRLTNLITDGDLPEYPMFRTYRYLPLERTDEEVELPFLCPVTASNLSQIIKSSKVLYDYVSKLLSYDALSLLFDAGRQEYVVMKKDCRERSLILPLKALADSLLRLIYYKTAIVSNKDAVLIIEEPEAHTYPPYISRMVHDVMACNDNQFFIATHSPYVVNEFLQEKADAAIFIVDADDGKTFVKRLTDNELSEIYEYGIDLFFNTESFMR